MLINYFSLPSLSLSQYSVLCTPLQSSSLRPVIAFESSEQKMDDNDESLTKWQKYSLTLEWQPADSGGLNFYTGMSMNNKEVGKETKTKTSVSNVYAGIFLDASKAY